MEGIPNQLALDVGSTCQIIPSFVDESTTSVFNFQLADNEDIMGIIQVYCNQLNTDEMKPIAEVGEQQLCLAILAKYESKYCRALIKEKKEESDGATVLFIDYGNEEKVPIKEIAKFPAGILHKFVPQAYLCNWENASKEGLRKLREMQYDEMETSVKIMAAQFDEVEGVWLYSVSLPGLESIKNESNGNEETPDSTPMTFEEGHAECTKKIMTAEEYAEKFKKNQDFVDAACQFLPNFRHTRCSKLTHT